MSYSTKAIIRMIMDFERSVNDVGWSLEHKYIDIYTVGHACALVYDVKVLL